MSESGKKIRRRTGGDGERREHSHHLPHPITVFSCIVPSIINEHLEQALSFLNSSKTQWCTILRRVSVECILYTVSEYASFSTIYVDHT